MSEKKMFHGWWMVAGCVIITATTVPLVMSCSNIYLIPVTEDMGISRTQFSLIATILQALGIILSPIVSKRLAGGNLRGIMTVSVLGFAAAYASYSLAQNVTHLYISGFFVGLFYFSATLIPSSIIITNWFVKQRGLAMSLTMAGVGLGGFIFSPLVTYLIGEFGWRATYQIMAAILLLTAFPTSALLLRKLPEDRGLKAYGMEEGGAGMASQGARAGVALSVKESYAKPFFILMLIGMFISGFINVGALGQFPPAIREMHGPAMAAGIIAMYSVIGIFGKILVGWINDKYGLMASTVFGCAAFALIFVFMLMGENVTMLYIMAICFGFGTAIGTVTPPLVTADIFGSQKYGEAYGLSNSAVQVGLCTGSVFVAYIFDTMGSYNPAWVILGVLTVINFLCWAGALILSRKYKEA